MAPQLDAPLALPPIPAEKEPAPAAPAAEQANESKPEPRVRPVRRVLPHRHTPPREVAGARSLPGPPTLSQAPAQPVPAPGEPAYAAALAGSAAAEVSFEGRLVQAIQAEASRNYPAAARLMGVTGQAVVSFRFRDGIVTQVDVSRSSGSGALDRAAAEAVQRADYPPTPQALVGKTLNDFVHVQYTLDPP